MTRRQPWWFFPVAGLAVALPSAWAVWVIVSGSPCWLLGNASVVCWLVRGGR